MRLVVARQSGMPDERRCRKCGETKPLAMFRTGNYGCKACQNVACAKRYAANRERYSAAAKVYRVANREKIAARHRRWYGARSDDVKARVKAYTAANSEKVKAYHKEYDLRRFGLGQADYDAMLAAQGGACWICRTTDSGGHGRWHIDHDHACCPGNRSCGRCVRGLLCVRCNAAIGLLGDSPALLRRAIEYLEASKGPRAVAG
jgi:hypothetical protein